MNGTPGEIFGTIVPLLRDLIDELAPDLSADAISASSRLSADLGMSSVDYIDLFVAIEKELGTAIGFHDLIMVDGRYVSDLSVGQLTEFLHARLNLADPERPAHARAPIPADPGPRSAMVDAGVIARFSEILPAPAPLPDPPKKHRRVVFLLSPPRSGSTLLQILLAGHPRLFAPPELHLLWFRDLKQRRDFFTHDANRHLVSGAIRAIMELEGLGVDEATRFMQRCEDSGMLARDFYEVLQARLGDRLLVDKTPGNAFSTEVLERCERYFDEPLFLHLTRHPGGVIRSFTEAKLERILPFMSRHEAEFSREQFAELGWYFSHRNILDFLQEVPVGRQYRTSFEALVTNPRETLEGICAFLGIDFRLDMLEPYVDKRRRMADGVGPISRMSGDLKFHLYRGIEPAAADRWRRYLASDQIAEPTWELAERLGYQRGG